MMIVRIYSSNREDKSYISQLRRNIEWSAHDARKRAGVEQSQFKTAVITLTKEPVNEPALQEEIKHLEASGILLLLIEEI